jgi:sigma-B regulation protein RsbU (phosphoserine phosphatase)
LGTVAVAGALAVFAATVRSRREGALITISERVQHAILRPLPAELGGMAFASHYQSATTQALVGGDLYDITMTQFGSTPTAWSRPGTAPGASSTWTTG